jgi:hypothetical protein
MKIDTYLARVTLMIGRKVAIDKLGLFEPALPLDTLDDNIVCKDALFNEWEKADAIVGNPPFLGGYRMRQELGDDYAERVFNRFADVKAQVDFCSYWFRLTHESIGGKGRAGLVGTNTISQGNTRKAGLDYITQNGGIIYEAVSSQKWSGEAVVHVSIVNWCYENPKNLYLDNQPVNSISSSLRTSTDISKALRLLANKEKCFEGVKPYGKGFIITPQQAQNWISVDPKNQLIFKRLSDATSLTKQPNGTPVRWIIDFNNMVLEDASAYKEPFNHLKQTVKPEREKDRVEKTRIYWWQFERSRPAMRKAILSSQSYFAIPRVSKWSIYIPIATKHLPDTSTNIVSSEDFYILGILTSDLHRNWVIEQSSTLKGDTRYTPSTCFETFPFPQNPTPILVGQIRIIALQLHEYRSGQMEQKQWGITRLYNNFFADPASQLYKLHAKLDALVLQAYGFSESDDLLEQLLTLNLELAEKEKRGEAIVGPWAPEPTV